MGGRILLTSCGVERAHASIAKGAVSEASLADVQTVGDFSHCAPGGDARADAAAARAAEDACAEKSHGALTHGELQDAEADGARAEKSQVAPGGELQAAAAVDEAGAEKSQVAPGGGAGEQRAAAVLTPPCTRRTRAPTQKRQRASAPWPRGCLSERALRAPRAEAKFDVQRVSSRPTSQAPQRSSRARGRCAVSANARGRHPGHPRRPSRASGKAGRAELRVHELLRWSLTPRSSPMTRGRCAARANARGRHPGHPRRPGEMRGRMGRRELGRRKLSWSTLMMRGRCAASANARGRHPGHPRRHNRASGKNGRAERLDEISGRMSRRELGRRKTR